MEKYIESKYRKEIDEIVASAIVMTLAFQDQQGPWTAPVYYSGKLENLFFLSSPDTRHGQAINNGLPFAASIFREPESWQKIKGLQIAGEVKEVESEEVARTSFLKKFPFVVLFLAKSRLIDPLIKEKAGKTSFYSFVPSQVTLVDNSVKFGFHHTVSL
jgi:uncharacterized protein YhbP (UPF0306 family)